MKQMKDKEVDKVKPEVKPDVKPDVKPEDTPQGFIAHMVKCEDFISTSGRRCIKGSPVALYPDDMEAQDIKDRIEKGELVALI